MTETLQNQFTQEQPTADPSQETSTTTAPQQTSGEQQPAPDSTTSTTQGPVEIGTALVIEKNPDGSLTYTESGVATDPSPQAETQPTDNSPRSTTAETTIVQNESPINGANETQSVNTFTPATEAIVEVKPVSEAPISNGLEASNAAGLLSLPLLAVAAVKRLTHKR